MTEADILRELTGDHPWIPGAVFKANPGLAEYLAAAVRAWFEEER